VYEGFVNPVNDAMRLFDGGVSPPEAELVTILISCARLVEVAV
jgi:hypothetical protein